MKSIIGKILRSLLGGMGYDVVRKGSEKEPPKVTLAVEDYPYKENPENNSASNIDIKLGEREEGRPFESRYITSVNKAAAQLIGDTKRIAEFGSGTGIFASEVVKLYEDVELVCSEIDVKTHTWAKENRSQDRITWTNDYIPLEDAPFDMVVSIDVIEHVGDYRAFIESCISLAPKAIIATPDKYRYERSKYASPPGFDRHTREWTIGEFYWVMKTFYQDVKMYGVQEGDNPRAFPVHLLWEGLTSMIAVCENPYSGNG